MYFKCDKRSQFKNISWYSQIAGGGYSISPMGSVIGLLWALADGFVGGAIFAWLYNRITGKSPA